MPQKKRYVQLGLTVFCTVGAILLFYDTLFGHRVLLHIWRKFLAAIAPILYGWMIPAIDGFGEEINLPIVALMRELVVSALKLKTTCASWFEKVNELHYFDEH